MSSVGAGGHSLPVKYGLALASLAGYVGLALAADYLIATGRMPDAGPWFQYAAGAVFGALVLGPYARSPHRVLRIFALAVVSAAIYWLAVRFVAEAPLPFGSIVSLMIAGSLAALLSGLAVIAIAPQPFGLGALALLLAGGAAGGAAFEIRIPDDELLLAGHAAWQLLVCVALHVGFRPAGLTSSSAS